MSNFVEAAIAFCEEANIGYHLGDEDTDLRGVLYCRSGIHHLLVHESGEKGMVAVFAGPNVPIKSKAAVAELLARLSSCTGMVRLEFDYDEGVISARATCALPEYGDVQPEAIGQLIRNAANTMGFFLPVFMAVAFGGIPPTRALDAWERDMSGDLDNESDDGDKGRKTIRIQLPPKRNDDQDGRSDG